MSKRLYILQSDDTYRICDRRVINASAFRNYIDTISIETILKDEKYDQLQQYITDDVKQMNILDLSFIDKNALDLYLQQYEHKNSLQGYITMIKINNIMCLDYNSKEIIDKRISYLKSLNESLHWKINNNCHVNITEQFIKRDITDTSFVRVTNETDVTDALLLDKTDEIDYLDQIINKHQWIDPMASKCVRKTYRYNNNNNITQDDINEIIFSKSIDSKEEYLLIMFLLSSNTHCHLILNNYDMLQYLQKKHFITQYEYIFEYAMKYSWVSLYLAECSKKRYLTSNENYIFDIDTANMLPDIRDNSVYMPLLINSKMKVMKYNLHCPKKIYHSDLKYGACTLEDFRFRLNYFLSKNGHNLFDELNWDNIVVCGSVMACCVPNFNPLMLRYMNTGQFNPTDIRFEQFVDALYKTADLDIGCNLCDNDYIDKVFEIRDSLEKSIRKYYPKIEADTKEYIIHYDIKSKDNSECIEDDDIIMPHNSTVTRLYKRINTVDNIVTININKMINIYISEKFISLYLLDKNVEDRDEKIKECKDCIQKINYTDDDRSNEIRNIIYDLYIKDSNETNVDPSYIENYMIVNIENIKIFNSTNEKYANEYIRYYPTIKFKLKSKYLKRDIEVFKLRYLDPMRTISQFHYGIVRSYYNGKTVLMTPSCVMACKTLTNIDYNFFAGVRPPQHNWIKYYLRGIGGIYNSKELAKLIVYCKHNPVDNEYICNINFNDIYESMYLLISHSIYDEIYGKYDLPRHSNYDKLYFNNPHTPLSFIRDKLKCISVDGNIYPLVPELFDAVWLFTNKYTIDNVFSNKYENLLAEDTRNAEEENTDVEGLGVEEVIRTDIEGTDIEENLSLTV